MSRKLTKNSIRPVVHYVQQNVNSGFYKFYHFTLDTYNDKPSFTGGTAYDIDGCYFTPRYDLYGMDAPQDKPLDEYAMNLETREVIRLSDKTTVMTVDWRS